MAEPTKSSKRPGLFAVALPICALIGGVGIWRPDLVAGLATDFTNVTFSALDWFFLAEVSFFVLLSGWLAFGRYGSVRLGADEDRPEFSDPAWFAMLFAGGMGAGLLFWGVAEPMVHFGSPPLLEGGTPEAARQAMIITNFHWGLHAWSVYAVAALVLAYFGYRLGTPALPGAPIRAAFKGPWVEPVAWLSDLLGVLAIAFGVAGSMAMSAMQLDTGLASVSGLEGGVGQRVVILIVLFVAYMISASTSLDKGIKILSQINLTLALLLMGFLLLAGPTADLLGGAITALGDYLAALPRLSLSTYPFQGKAGWLHGWTLVYFIWWIAWAPFVGIFIARISRGRTIREFVVGVVIAPSLFSLLWFAVFGGTGLHEEFASGGLAEAVRENVTVALFTLYERLPFSGLLGGLSLCLVFVFMVTSVDSATYVLGMLTSEGSLDPPVRRKLAWGVSLAVLGGALMLSGQVPVIRALAILGAIPFAFVMLIQIAALLRVLRKEHP